MIPLSSVPSSIDIETAGTLIQIGDSVPRPGTRYTPQTRHTTRDQVQPLDQVHPPGPGTPPRPGTPPAPRPGTPPSLGPGTPPEKVHPLPWTRYTPRTRYSPPRTREIRSTRGRYASCWNAILLDMVSSILTEKRIKKSRKIQTAVSTDAECVAKTLNSARELTIHHQATHNILISAHSATRCSTTRSPYPDTSMSTNIRSLKYPKCDSTFTFESQLKAHQFAHRKKPSFFCVYPKCGKAISFLRN